MTGPTGLTNATEATEATEATGPSEATGQPSPVCTDAIWRLPVTVCRITQFLGDRTAGALLERAIASTGDTLRPSMIRDHEVVPDFRRSRSHQDFAAPELISAIDEVVEAVEHTLGVSCQYTEPDYTLNVHNDGDFYRAHQDSTAEFSPRRLLTFVYYLHRTPRPFDGGELRMFDAALPLHTGTTGKWQERTWRDWEPEHDSIVFFRPTAWHEVRPVSCPSKRHEAGHRAVVVAEQVPRGDDEPPQPARQGRTTEKPRAAPLPQTAGRNAALGQDA